MIKLKAVILQLEEGQFRDLSKQLKENKAEKFYTLLTGFREGKDESDIIRDLDVNSSAYYTLKSRLFTKIQEFLTESVSGSKVDLLRNIANIPNLLFNTHKDTALAVLTKMEKDLLEFDLPYELTNVYNALKKLHINSPKYYEYTQQYNKHVAYTVALDKAEDLLANFTKNVGEYFVSRDKSKLPILALMKKEMANLSRLYRSHHLSVYQAIMDATVALYLPLYEETRDDDPVEDILAKADSITRSFPKDITYQYLSNVIAFLNFEYYQQIRQHKKAAQYFEQVNEILPSFLLYNFCCFPSRFLLAKIEKYAGENKISQLKQENEQLVSKYQAEETDAPNFINYNLYLAASAFYLKRFQDTCNILNNLLNTISFKNYYHSELEVKLLLAFGYSMLNKYEQAHTVIRSVGRKIRETENGTDYENASTLVKMIKMQMDAGSQKVEQKLFTLRDRFQNLNRGDNPVLSFLVMDDQFIKNLGKAIK